MTKTDWRKQKRNHGGSVKTINGILYARIQYLDDITGKRKEKLRRADSRTHARSLIKQMRNEFNEGGQSKLNSDKMTFEQLAEKYKITELVPAAYETARRFPADVRSNLYFLR